MPDLADVVIVGGGILGTALTYALSRHNYRVVLLEAQSLAGGVTRSSFAWINGTAKYEDETYHRLNAQGVAHYAALAAEWGAGAIGLHGGGALLWAVGADAQGREQLRRRAARLQGWGYPVTLLDAAEMQALEPQVAFGGSTEGAEGLFAPADRWLDSRRLIRFFVEQARQRNADIRERCPVTGFTRSVIPRAISTVETPQGRIATRLLILAAGAQTPALVAAITGDPADSRWVPLRRVPGLLVETPPCSAEACVHRILFPPDTGGLHLRPTPEGGLLLGADDADALVQTPADPPGRGEVLSPSVEAVHYPETAPALLLERTTRALPALPAESLQPGLTARVCVRPVPADGFPIVGSLPVTEGVYVAVTHSGITLGPLLAHLLLQEILTGQPSSLLAPYHPHRFSNFPLTP